MTSSPRRRRGIALVWAVAVTTALMVVAALAVDWGRVVLARSQLQAAADAAARHAAGGVGTAGAVARRAAAAAADNGVAGNKVRLVSARAVCWDDKARAVNASAPAASANAAEVVLEADVETPLAELWGRGSRTLRASAVASNQVVPGAGARFIGLDGISVTGARLDSYDSSRQGFPASPSTSTRRFSGHSNGTVNLLGGTSVHGWMSIAEGGSISTAGGSAFYGGSALTGTDTLDLDREKKDGDAQKMGNYKLKRGHNTLPGGKYHFASFDIPAGSTLEFTGPAEVFFTGNVNLNGGLITFGNKPENLRMVQHSAAWIDVKFDDSVQRDWAIDFYAPKSRVEITGAVNFHGRLRAGRITMSGGASFYADEALPADTATEAGGSVVLVR